MTSAPASERVRLMRDSLLRLTGRDLFDGLAIGDDITQAVFDAPYALVSHDTSDDPIFVYGNAMALRLFELSWDDFTALPSRRSDEPMERSEREQLLAWVTADGYIDDYTGVRISSGGRRFLINDAIVWNLVDDNGTHQGQAALFDHYTRLDDADMATESEPAESRH